MITTSRESSAQVGRGGRIGVGLALMLASLAPLAAAAQARGQNDSQAREAPIARAESGDRGSWNSGGSTPPNGSGSSASSGSAPSARPSGSTPGGGRSEWSDRRSGGHRDGGHSGGRVRGGYYPPYYWNPWWWGLWWGWDGPYGGYYGRGFSDEGGEDQGALDLDIWPGDTQVYLDGQYIGTVDDFDGFPRYLWLEKGTYDLVFYRDGYRTLARQYSIYPGLVVDVGDRLERGESIRPEDLPTKTHERRDTRIREERERAERIDADGRSLDEDEDAIEVDRSSRRPSRDRALDDEQGRLTLSIEPDDASVYLDGKFLGTGAELERLRRGLIVEPGQHRVAVVRPGRRAQETVVTVPAGGEEELEIELEPSGD